MSTERLPEDLESERSLLATICAPGAESQASECCIVLRREDFMHPAHQAIFGALVKVLNETREVEIQLIAESLRVSGDMRRVGGFPGLMEILGAAEVRRPMALVEILQGHRRRRDLIRLGAHIQRQAQEDAETPEAIIHGAGSELSRIAQVRQSGGIQHIASFSDDAFADLTDEFNGHRGKASWVKGWSRLNGMTGGFKPGQLIVLAARPGIGKTALALNWLLGVTEYNQSAGFFSLEMPAKRLWRRLVAAHSGVDLRAMVERQDRGAYQSVGLAKAELDNRGIWIEDRSSLTPQEILAETARMLTRSHSLGLLVVDYLGLVSSGDSTKASRQTEATRIGDLTRGFKLLAGEFEVPVLLLTQMSREVEKRANGRPQLSDLRDSGCIEQDADMVMFIHRKMTGVQDPSAELILAKHREGPIGTIPIRFNPETTRYSEVERETGSGYEPSYSEPVPSEPFLAEAM